MSGIILRVQLREILLVGAGDDRRGIAGPAHGEVAAPEHRDATQRSPAPAALHQRRREGKAHATRGRSAAMRAAW